MLHPSHPQTRLKRGHSIGFRALLGLLSVLGVTLTSACATANSVADPAAPALPSVKLHRVDTRVGTLAVHDTGPGSEARTLVLWPSVLADASLYRFQVQALRSKYRIVTVDGPGHGASGAAPGPFTMADCAHALSQVLSSLGERTPVVVAGTSWGGLVAGEFALAYPTSTAGVVMLNTPVFASERGFSDRFVSWSSRWMNDWGLFTGGVSRAFFLPSTRAAGGEPMQRFDDHLRRADGRALGPAVRAVLIDREALAPRMNRIAAPTLVIVGDQDTMYPMQTLRDAASKLQRGRFEVVESAHISVVDRPAQTSKLIEDFVDALPR